MKVWVEVFASFVGKQNREEINKITRTRLYEITNTEEIKEVLSQMGTDLEIQFRTELSESGLTIKQITKIKFHYDKYNPTRGGSFIELPKWVQSKKACINIQNEDDKCLMYSIQCGVYKVYEKDHCYRVSKYKNLDDNLNWDNVKFPSTMRDIDRLEENNEGVISVNVYSISSELQSETILLHRKTKVAKSKHHIDLLKLEEGNKSHYVFIKDYDKLMSSQTNKKKIRKYHWKHCLHGYSSEALLQKHYDNGCLAVEGQQTQMPNPEKPELFYIKF